MKIMVVGGGGREHTIVCKLKESKNVDEIYVLPGNGGIAADAVCVNIGAKDLDKICDFAVEKGIDFAVIAPDDPLVLGAVDRLNAVGVPCFGPNAAAAIIEGSKVFSKNLMKKYGIPTAAYETFTSSDEAIAYLKNSPYPIVIKADGLALGKGVTIAEDFAQAEAAVRSAMEDKVFGESGNALVIEEFMTGPEVSVLCFTDGNVVKPMVSSMDHKRIGDGDMGPNTGGMGTIAPNPFYTEDVAERCMKEIFLPTMHAMNAEGRVFRGCLYFGLMLTPNGPKVVEYNCRFGDPETQVVLPLLESDLLEVMQATAAGTLADTEVKFSDKAAACIVMASGGYPTSYKSGFEITLPETLAENERIFIAGAKAEDGKLYTSGGRVLGAVAVEQTLPEALKKAYALAERIHFENAVYRKDIGARALAKEK
ncbi:MAG: phosphoribosylamine--glycine ligase [Ruminococcaceae bacterium]|nr:phosphoribosylamine--glycine ligase [Oscillospiraceae bacterium]